MNGPRVISIDVRIWDDVRSLLRLASAMNGLYRSLIELVEGEEVSWVLVALLLSYLYCSHLVASLY